VILDLEGAPSPARISPRLGWMLSLASAAVATAALLVIAGRPPGPATRLFEVERPSVLEQAFAQPAPARLALLLPPEVAVPLAPTGSQYGSGIGRNALASRTYRLRGTNHLVSVAPVPDALPITAPATRPPDALLVRGNYAQSWMFEPTSLSVVRWTEHGSTYEISSRSLRAPDLVRIAELLR
jgi:hypothetical protein